MKVVLLFTLLCFLSCKNASQTGEVDNTPSPLTSLIEANNDAAANGFDSADIIITLLDASKNPVVGVVPTFSATDFDNTNKYGACSVSDKNGVSKCTLSSFEGELKVLAIKTPIYKVGGSVNFTEVDHCTGNELNAPFADGDGTSGNPYGICTLAQFASIGANPNYLDKHFKLYKNLDFSSYTGTSAPVIGSTTVGFSGTFNGNRKTISNFTYTNLSDTEGSRGLFRRVSASGVIKHINLTNVNVIAKPKLATGGLVGTNYGTIENCSVEGKVEGYSQVGGVAGNSLAETQIIKSSFEGNVTGSANLIGGVVGRLGGNIYESYAKGQVKGTLRIGGLVGGTLISSEANISDSHFEGTVESTLTGEAGGLVGKMVGNIKNSYAKATISCISWCGGLVGTYSDAYFSSLGKKTLIEKSYAESTITGVDSVGGLVGYSFLNADIENCYAKTSINSSGDYIAGLVGGAYGAIKNSYALPSSLNTVNTNRGGLVSPGTTGLITHSFWDKELDPSIPNTEPEALTTAQMKTTNIFLGSGWDPSVWNFTNGSYPTLK